MSGTHGSIDVPNAAAMASLVDPVDLEPLASGVWTVTGLQITLPAPGRYVVMAAVTGVLHFRLTNNPATGTPTLTVQARLTDATAGAVLTDAYVVTHCGLRDPGAVSTGGVSPIHHTLTVTAATVIRLDARYVLNPLTSDAEAIPSTAIRPPTSLTYMKVE